MRVLYIDDDRINTLLFEEACRIATGVEAEVAGSGAEAVAVAEQWQPDVLVLDLHLPDTNGYELLARLREQPSLASAPAFLCTADNPNDVGAAALAAGFRGCWSKPVDLKTIISELTALGLALPAR